MAIGLLVDRLHDPERVRPAGGVEHRQRRGHRRVGRRALRHGRLGGVRGRHPGEDRRTRQRGRERRQPRPGAGRAGRCSAFVLRRHRFGGRDDRVIDGGPVVSTPAVRQAPCPAAQAGPRGHGATLDASIRR
ncbi:MAG: hypothetical protein ACK54X_14510, partial [Burkholderiales bacterium]